MEGSTGTRGRDKKRLRLDAWAFARISLKLTDDEYSRYTPAEVAALMRAYQKERDYTYALSTVNALVSKWSNPENIIPWEPKHLMPMTREEYEERQAMKEKERIAQQHFLAAELKDYAQSLPPIKK